MWLSEKAKASLGEVRDLPDMKPIIEKIIDGLQIHYDNGVVRAVQDCGIHVDKERLLKALTDARAFYDEGYAAGQTAQQKWNPVTERLPEKGERVLATDGGFVGEMYINKRGQWQRYNVNDSALMMALDILWWMPMPLPPKEGKK